MPALEVDHLTVRYGAVTAVDGVTFSAEPGQVLALLGPNGAGKTSTLETLEGYRKPSAGHVRVLGLDPVADAPTLLPQIGVMLQTGGVYPSARVGEVLSLFASYYADPQPPGDLLDLVGLGARRTAKVRTLSGGEQQRLSLALALVGRPKVAFLDEPTAGMDPAARQLLWAAVRDLQADGVCVLLTTHYLEEAEKLADRVVIIDRGRIIAEGTPQELMRSQAGELRFGAPVGIDVAALSDHLGATVAEVTPGEYLAAIEGTPRIVAALASWLAEHDLSLADLRAGRQSLEDVYLRLTSPADDLAAAGLDDVGRRRRRTRTHA